MASTSENLKAAFAGESQANRRYLFFAEKAEKEGHGGVARLFRAIAEAETVHARNHLNNLDQIKSTKENLQEAIGGEHYEFTRMYPEFIEQARKDGARRAESSFDWANKVEEIHHGLYQKALEALEGGRELEEKTYFICEACGYTVSDAAPDKCPICGAPKNRFKQLG